MTTHYLAHYKPAFAFSDILCVPGYSTPCGAPFHQGTIQVYHVPSLEQNVNLVARYRPRSYIGYEKGYPQLSPTSITVLSPLIAATVTLNLNADECFLLILPLLIRLVSLYVK
ncbi:MAG: hypothetical protein AAF443_05525 [Chlamydiota bacterium]